MIKFFVKWSTWMVLGVLVVLLVSYKAKIESPWKYTFQSTVQPGTQVSFTPPNGETSTAEITTPATASKTMDFGVAVLAIPYIVGSFVGFCMRSRRRPQPSMTGL